MDISNDVFQIMKSSGAIRKFIEKPIPEKSINKILEAGIWSASILGLQPWYYVCVINKRILQDVSKVLREHSKLESGGVDKIMAITSDAIKASSAMIAVYNKENVQRRTKALNDKYVEHARISELQAIGASIQNMILMTTSLGLRCVWVNTPTYVESEVNSILKEDKKLVSCLILGFADSEPARSKRAPMDTLCKIVK